MSVAAKRRMPRGARVRACGSCGCTDLDCRKCIERTGEPCHWVDADLCSACAFKHPLGIVFVAHCTLHGPVGAAPTKTPVAAWSCGQALAGRICTIKVVKYGLAEVRRTVRR